MSERVRGAHYLCVDGIQNHSPDATCMNKARNVVNENRARNVITLTLTLTLTLTRILTLTLNTKPLTLNPNHNPKPVRSPGNRGTLPPHANAGWTITRTATTEAVSGCDSFVSAGRAVASGVSNRNRNPNQPKA